MYICQFEGEMFIPMGILWCKYEALPKYGSIPQHLFESSESHIEWKHVLDIIPIVPHT